MKDFIALLGAIGFFVFLVMLVMGVAASGIQFWVELFF
jgi:hypothetical protein